VTIFDNRGLCQHSGLCTDRVAAVFHTGSEPFVTPSGGRLDEIVRAVRDCPSGALSYGIDEVEARQQVDWNGSRPATITITADGPYRLTGGIDVVDDALQPIIFRYRHTSRPRWFARDRPPRVSGIRYGIERDRRKNVSWNVRGDRAVPEPCSPPRSRSRTCEGSQPPGRMAAVTALRLKALHATHATRMVASRNARCYRDLSRIKQLLGRGAERRCHAPHWLRASRAGSCRVPGRPGAAAIPRVVNKTRE
jgi:uncharacterized Fe-S cluster protein YjdI